MKKETENTPVFAAEKLGTLPRVGGNIDISLGFSHRYAMEIALNALSELTAPQRGELFKDIHKVFDQWKIEHGKLGVANNPFARALLGTPNTEGKVSEEDRLSLIQDKEPWECADFITTPVSLFFKLFGEEYPRLEAYMNDNALAKYDYILATVILMSDNPDSEYQSSDCIEGALKLATFKMSLQSALIKTMKPDSEMAFNRRKKKALSTKTQKEETERVILTAHAECQKEGNNMIKEIAARTGKSPSTVSRHLRSAGYERYNTK